MRMLRILGVFLGAPCVALLASAWYEPIVLVIAGTGLILAAVLVYLGRPLGNGKTPGTFWTGLAFAYLGVALVVIPLFGLPLLLLSIPAFIGLAFWLGQGGFLPRFRLALFLAGGGAGVLILVALLMGLAGILLIVLTLAWHAIMSFIAAFFLMRGKLVAIDAPSGPARTQALGLK